jgi:endonuclease/exonuclease/phosphatase family metal-dependent hydrolase
MTLRVMTFNIFYGGDEVDLEHGRWCYEPFGCPETLDKVEEVIRASGADIVGMQEATGNAPLLAERLGWDVNERLQIISRYPLIDPPGGNGIYVFARVAPAGYVAVANVHLTSDPYGPYLVRDGASRQEVLALERRTRLPEITGHIRELPALAAAGIPVFMTGDFNSPSHLDWTREVAAVRDVVDYPIVWPVSKALADAGLRDSYREAHPDPVATPGFTWTPPGTLESVRNEVHDRIDWVLAAGPAITLASRIVGEVDGPDVDIEIDPYPSDHRAVVSTFRIESGDPRPFAAVDERRVFVGNRLKVWFHGTGQPGERVAIVPAGAGRAVASRSTGSADDGSLVFSSDTWPPGDYLAVLLSGDGTVRSRSPLWVYPAGGEPRVWTSKRVYAPGEPIVVSWEAAPGYKWDWLGVYRAGWAPEPIVEECTSGYCGNLHYLIYTYTRGSIEGTTRFDRYTSSVGYTSWPLNPGRYRIRLLLDDGYKLLAISARFRIVR